MIEHEKTYLAKYLPDLKNCKNKEIIDIYIPNEMDHPKIRIRKNDDIYEITKKVPVKDDASHQEEQTIKITKEEFDFLKNIKGKKTHKIRYYYNYKGKIAEIDVFQDKLKGLVIIDFEFDSEEEKEKFEIPDFCLVDVTHELFVAGGMICGKSYKDVEKDLKKFGYKKIYE